MRLRGRPGVASDPHSARRFLTLPAVTGLESHLLAPRDCLETLSTNYYFYPLDGTEGLWPELTLNLLLPYNLIIHYRFLRDKNTWCFFFPDSFQEDEITDNEYSWSVVYWKSPSSSEWMEMMVLLNSRKLAGKQECWKKMCLILKNNNKSSCPAWITSDTFRRNHVVRNDTFDLLSLNT